MMQFLITTFVLDEAMMSLYSFTNPSQIPIRVEIAVWKTNELS